jgi:hypothetical protein
MITLTGALTEARQKRQSKYNEFTLQWQLAQGVLQALGERLITADLPRWYFIPNGEEIVIIYHQPGTGSKERVGAWSVDEQFRLSLGDEKTEWITRESWRRVIDKAVVITAEVILDREAQNAPAEPVVVALRENQRVQRPTDNAS